MSLSPIIPIQSTFIQQPETPVILTSDQKLNVLKDLLGFTDASDLAFDNMINFAHKINQAGSDDKFSYQGSLYETDEDNAENSGIIMEYYDFYVTFTNSGLIEFVKSTNIFNKHEKLLVSRNIDDIINMITKTWIK